MKVNMDGSDDSQFLYKRARKTLTLAERVAVIREHEKERSATCLAEMFECGRTQIQSILRQKERYLHDWEHRGDPTYLRRRVILPSIILNLVVFEWIKRSHFHNILVNDEIVRDIGEKAIKALQITNLRADSIWLYRFKRKYNFRDINAFDFSRLNDYSMKPLDFENIISDLEIEFGSKLMPSDDNLTAYHLDAVINFEKNIVREVKKINNQCQDITNEIQEGNSSQSITCIDLSSDDSYSECGSLDANTQGTTTYQMNSKYEESTDSKEIRSYKDALNYLAPLEQFAFLANDVRAIGLINQLENALKEEMASRDE